MPGPNIWDNYAVAGILLVVIIVIGSAVRKVFAEYRQWQTEESEKQRQWQEEQFARRENENERQRSWYSTMEKAREIALTERDKQWTSMVRDIQALIDRRDRESHQTLMELTQQTRLLTEGITAHDARVENRIKQFERYLMRKRAP